jgi:RimJ/RimL family protein N-acetyltransferase
MGMRPDLVGRGYGATLLELVICEAHRRWKRLPLRTTIASFNERSTNLVRKFRFREVEIFRNPAGREFVIFLGR